jgi:hypothetical protein
MKRNKMKKIVALVAVLFSVVVPVQSSSADQKSLVIIDAYFDSKVSAPNVKCIVVSTNSACTDVVKVSHSLITNDINHGNAMAEVAKKQNPSLPIILLRSSGGVRTNSVNQVNPGNFIDALKWVYANSSSVSAVSFSRNLNRNSGDGICSPTTTGTNLGTPQAVDQVIRELITKLKNNGVQVFASTGNKRGTKIDYPACILDTVSVGTGGVNLAGNIVSSNAFDSNTDYVGSLPENKFSYLGTVAFGTGIAKYYVPQTTSSATVAVAAQYVTNGVLPSKVVKVLP